MNTIIAFALLLTTALAGGNLELSFQDCGDSSTDAVVKDVEPKSIATGSTTVITGSGSLKKDVTGGSYSMTMTGAGGIKLLDCSGDASQAQSCDVKAPLLGKVGSLDYQPVSFPIKAGDITGVPKVGVTLKAGLPSALEATTTTLQVTGSDGDKVICVKIMTKAAAHAVSDMSGVVVAEQPRIPVPMPEVMPVAFSYGGALALSFQDCGDSSTDAVVKDVEPKSIAAGSTTVITGSGSLKKDVTGGSYTMTMTGAGGIKLLDCSGDASQAQSCDVKAPLLGKVGSLDYQPVSFPIKAGDITGVPKVGVTLKAGLPSALEATTTTLQVTGSDGDKVICVKIMTKAASYSSVLV